MNGGQSFCPRKIFKKKTAVTFWQQKFKQQWYIGKLGFLSGILELLVFTSGILAILSKSTLSMYSNSNCGPTIVFPYYQSIPQAVLANYFS
jgi:hypothetical protein